MTQTGTVPPAADWMTRVADAIRTALGAGPADDALARWRQLADRPEPLVTLYGPYDSGKSSLLKRLLHEDASPVPDWLTISARRETFEVKEVTSAGVIFRDCPGIATGDEEHRRLADAALELTDAVLLVLPPQLMTTGREEMLKIVTGAHFGPSSALGPTPWPTALAFVVGRMDELGPDPVDDPAAFRGRRARKHDELAKLLSASGISETQEIHLVCADPYGLTGRRPDATRSDFAPWAAWDGISDLRRYLARLPADRGELRRAAGRRYWTARAAQALGETASALSSASAALDEARRGREHVASVASRLTAIDEAARADLNSRIRLELESVADSAGGISAQQVRDEATRRLGFCVEVWSRQWMLQLAQLARDGRTELEAWAARPAVAGYERHLDALAAAAGRSTARPHSETSRNLLGNAGMWIPQAASAEFHRHFGVSVTNARIALSGLQTGQGAPALGILGGDGGQGGAAQTGETLRHLHQVDLLAFAPLLISLGNVVWTEIDRAQITRAERERRARLARELDQAVRDISAQILGTPESGGHGWAGRIEEFKDALARLEPSDVLLDGMSAAVDRLTEAGDALADLLGESP